MENNPTETTDQTKTIETTDNGIVVQSVEDDMRNLGIDVEESMANEEADDPEAADHEPKEDGQEKPKKKSRAQRRIERQARELKEKDEEIKRLKGGRESNQDNSPGEEEDHGIDIDDFDTYEEYRAAVESAKEVAKSKADDTDAPKGISKELDVRIANMTEDGQEDYSNFDEVVRNPELPLTVQVLEAITESESAADIAYYLGTHLDRAKKLAKMDRRGMEREILRIEIELENKPNKVVRTTKAPEPINPVKGGNSAEGKTLDDNDLTYEQHEALLNQGRKASRGGFL